MRDPVGTASQDFSGLRMTTQARPAALTDLLDPLPWCKTAAMSCGGMVLLRWALRARHLWAPQPPLPAIENPKRLRSRHRLVQPRIVWRRGATRILNSLGLYAKWASNDPDSETCTPRSP